MSKSIECAATSGGRAGFKTGSLVAAAVGLCVVAVCVAPAHAGETEVPGTDAAVDSVPSASEQAGCVESRTVLCLHDGRYEVKLQYVTSDGVVNSAAVARPRTTDSGLFYFFEPNNWEMLLKVLDGCGVNRHHWVFAASATDVGLHLVVRDTTTDASKTYTKEPGEPAPAITDVGAFPDACAAP